MPRGRPFPPGVSGNPAGRPRVIAGVRELARKHTPAAVATLVEIMLSPKASPATRVTAATALLERGFDRASKGAAS